MKIGLCGTSNISKTYIKCFRKLGHNIEIVYGNNLERLKKFTNLHSIPHYTNDINDLIKEKDINSYVIANDPSKHLDVAEILIKSDKDILIEKPIDISLNKIESFYQLIKNKKNIVHVVNQNRFDPFYIEIKKRLENLIINNKDTKYANLTMFFYRDNDYFESHNNWKKNYSCPMINQGIHYLDLLIWFFGNFLDVKSLSQKDNKELKLNDNIVGSIKFRNNILVNVFASTSVKRNEIKFEFFSEKKILKFKKDYLSSKLKKFLINSKTQFDLFSDQCKLFVNSINNRKLQNNNVSDAYQAVKLAKELNNLNN